MGKTKITASEDIKSTFVMIPTYNECENIQLLIDEILSLKIHGLNIVVVDDNSPDGTWKIVEQMAKRDKRVHLLHRVKDKGRSFAGRAGFLYALEHNADYVVEMDADFSHQTKYIPEMLKLMDDYDVVLGSRFVKGGKDLRPGKLRWIISYLSGFYIRLVFGTSVQDCNSGYRCFRAEALRGIELEKTISGPTPSIVQEILYLVAQKGYRIKEIPILFQDRTRGKSTLTFRALIQGLIDVLRFRMAHR